MNFQEEAYGSILGKRGFDELDNSRVWDECKQFSVEDTEFDFFDPAFDKDNEQVDWVNRLSVSSGNSSATCVSVVSEGSEGPPSPPLDFQTPPTSPNSEQVECVVDSPAPEKADNQSLFTDINLNQPEPLKEVADVGYELRFSGEMESVWYADRPFPRFAVSVVDPATNETATNVDDWKIAVSVLDGFGNDASDKVYGQIHNHMYDVRNGSVVITGLRFCAVSSKAGGHFRIVVTVVHPEPAAEKVRPLHSENIQILSYRLYHAPKVSFDKLKPEDSVGKMKGIGSLYAKRFAAIGIRTVSQLANIDTDKLGDEGCKMLLQNLRKDRGAMTLAKLSGYIQQARDIVTRYNMDQPTQGNQPNKRVKVEHPSPVYNSFDCISPTTRKIKIEGVQMGALPLAFVQNRPINCYIKFVA